MWIQNMFVSEIQVHLDVYIRKNKIVVQHLITYSNNPFYIVIYFLEWSHLWFQRKKFSPKYVYTCRRCNFEAPIEVN